MLAYFVCRWLFKFIGLGFVRHTIVERQSFEEFQECIKKYGKRLNFFCNVIDTLISQAGFAMLAGTLSSPFTLHAKTHVGSDVFALRCALSPVGARVAPQ